MVGKYDHLSTLKRKDTNPHGKLLYKSDAVPWLSEKVACHMLGLATEIYTDSNIFDPFVGNGLLQIVSQVRYYNQIKAFYGIDINPNNVATALANIQLHQNTSVLEARIIELQNTGEIPNRTPKDFERLKRAIASRDVLPTPIWQGNALNFDTSYLDKDVVIVSDPPYGIECPWYDHSGQSTKGDFLEAFLQKTVENDPALVVLSIFAHPNQLEIAKKYLSLDYNNPIQGRRIIRGKVK
jgi:hypothetical protein